MAFAVVRRCGLVDGWARYGDAFASESEGRDMRTTTTAVLAVGATVLAIPSAAHAQAQSSVQVPLAGHLTVASQMEAEHTELAQQRLTRKAWRLADRLADVRDRGFSPRAYRRRVSRRRARHARPPRPVPAERPRRRPAEPSAAGPPERRDAPPPPRSRRSRRASPAATRAPTPATASTANTSSRSRRGRASAGRAIPIGRSPGLNGVGAAVGEAAYPAGGDPLAVGACGDLVGGALPGRRGRR